MSKAVGLKRELGLGLLTFYGLGNILGAGIYVLVGKVAAVSGLYTPISFFLASLLAGFTAFSYAELSARYPISAGESVYVHEGFGIRTVSLAVGLLIVLAGMLSSAAIAQGFIGYLGYFIETPRLVTISFVVLLLFALAAWGIAESVRVAALLTVLEIIGLVLILTTAPIDAAVLSERLPDLLPDFKWVTWYGIIWGALLAFYAYIGFEDMVNVAEEVKRPQRNMPLSIFIALGVSATLYFLIALVAILSLPIEQLAASDAPLALIYQQNTGQDPLVISAIGLFAVINGALIQIIMVSRILYGLANKGWLPALLASVNRHTHTPVISTLLAAVVVWLFSISFNISELAENTSFVILIVFAMINLALIRIKIRLPSPAQVQVYPVWIPVMGLLTASGFIVFKLLKF